MDKNNEGIHRGTGSGVKTGLVIGKFMPPHNGHIAMIRFAAGRCGRVIVYADRAGDKPIPVETRYGWLKQIFAGDPAVDIIKGEEELPQSSIPDRDISRVWASFLKKKFPEVTAIITSEGYGDFVAGYMGIEHIPFDPPRSGVSISATAVRDNPVRYWDFIPEAVRPYYLKKICVYGPESAGKSTLAEQLAARYNTVFIPEMAREVLGERHVDDIVYEDFPAIAESHAKKILELEKSARGILFCDTDILTTIIYSKRYFGRVPDFPQWIFDANRFDHYLFCDSDVPWVEDRHRNSLHIRTQLRDEFLEKLETNGLPFTLIRGGWDERFAAATAAVDKIMRPL